MMNSGLFTARLHQPVSTISLLRMSYLTREILIVRYVSRGRKWLAAGS